MAPIPMGETLRGQSDKMKSSGETPAINQTSAIKYFNDIADPNESDIAGIILASDIRHPTSDILSGRGFYS